MNASQWLDQVRNYLDDQDKIKFPDSMVFANGDSIGRSMFEIACRLSPDWHNTQLVFDGANARQMDSVSWAWKLPPWVRRVVKAHVRNPTNTTDTPTFAQGQATTIVTEGQEIPKTDAVRKKGWMWDGNYGFMLLGYNQVPDISIRVAKVPPRMFRATIKTETANKKQMVLPDPLELGLRDIDEGAYINAEVQCVATVNAAGLNLGVVRRVIYSTATATVGGARAQRLDFESDWPELIVNGDIFETLVPWPDSFGTYHVLRTVQSTIPKKPNLDLLRTIAPELAREEQQFKEAVAPQRDRRGPIFYNSRTRPFQQRDPDHLPSNVTY